MKSNLFHKDDLNQAHIVEVFLRNITRSLPQYIFWKNQKSVYLGCNDNFARLVGLSGPEEIIGKTDLELNWQPTGHSAEEFQQGDQETLNGHPLTNREEILALPNGKKLITLVSKLPIIDDDHHVLGIVGYFTDITPLKKKERALRQAKRQAEAANQAKSVFITNISHDLRTPLTGLLGMAEVLQKEVRTTQGKAAAADLLKAGMMLLNLLNEVIEFSRCESGDLPLHEVKFDLLELIQNLIALLKPSAQDKNLDFKVTIDEHLPRYVISDSARLQRILLNLLGNAIKFTHQGAINLSIRVTKLKAQCVIVEYQVQDTGIGIREDQQALIFTRFSRLHPAYQGQYAGSGLGLALVKQFVNELKGEIHIDSVEGQGSIFSCLIPLRIPLSSGSEYTHPVKSPRPPADLHVKGTLIPFRNRSSVPANPTVLIVEDNKMAQQVIKNLMESLGAIVETADDGAQALQKIQNNDFLLIVMDLGLPDFDGDQVTLKIHQWQQENQHSISWVVALSAHLGEAERKRCFAAGMIRVYEKPLQREAAQELLDLMKANPPTNHTDKGNRHESY